MVFNLICLGYYDYRTVDVKYMRDCSYKLVACLHNEEKKWTSYTINTAHFLKRLQVVVHAPDDIERAEASFKIAKMLQGNESEDEEDN